MSLVYIKKNEINIDDLSRNCFIEACLKTKDIILTGKTFFCVCVCVENFQSLAALNIWYQIFKQPTEMCAIWGVYHVRFIVQTQMIFWIHGLGPSFLRQEDQE